MNGAATILICIDAAAGVGGQDGIGLAGLLVLPVCFVIYVEEQLVLLHRAANLTAHLVQIHEGNRNAGGVVVEGIGSEVVVPVLPEHSAMVLIGPLRGDECHLRSSAVVGGVGVGRG